MRSMWMMLTTSQRHRESVGRKWRTLTNEEENRSKQEERLLTDGDAPPERLLADHRWRAFEARAERAGGIAFFLQAAYAAADGHLWSDAERLLKKVIEQAPGCVDAYV